MTTSRLTFEMLRQANMARLPQFRNAHGWLSHPGEFSDGSNWSLSDWMVATAGELGEAANILKKFNRDDIPREVFIQLFADELAGILVYLDILAFRAGISLDAAVIKKFNQVSERVQADVRLSHAGVVRDSRGD